MEVVLKDEALSAATEAASAVAIAATEMATEAEEAAAAAVVAAAAAVTDTASAVVALSSGSRPYAAKTTAGSSLALAAAVCFPFTSLSISFGHLTHTTRQKAHPEGWRNCWREIPGSTFKVRDFGYATNGRKVSQSSCAPLLPINKTSAPWLLGGIWPAAVPSIRRRQRYLFGSSPQLRSGRGASASCHPRYLGCAQLPHL